MALRDMEYDRPRLEEGEIAFFIGRNLPERMKHTMRGFLHLTERKKTNVVRLAHFFKRPANAHVTRLSLAAIGRPFKSGDGGGHWNAPGDCIAPSCRRCRGEHRALPARIDLARARHRVLLDLVEQFRDAAVGRTFVVVRPVRGENLVGLAAEEEIEPQMARRAPA